MRNGLNRVSSISVPLSTNVIPSQRQRNPIVSWSMGYTVVGIHHSYQLGPGGSEPHRVEPNALGKCSDGLEEMRVEMI